MKYIREDLERMIHIEKLPYLEIGKKYNVSGAYIKKIANKLEMVLPRRRKFPEGWVPHNKGKKKTLSCSYCNKQCNYPNKKFCSLKCMGLANKAKTHNKYKEAVNSKENIASYHTIGTFKKYILEEQNNSCIICGIPSKWNNMNLVLILDHIDGNAANNQRENLRCICPNCDSQLPTFKSRNKNSARKERYLKNYKN